VVLRLFFISRRPSASFSARAEIGIKSEEGMTEQQRAALWLVCHASARPLPAQQLKATDSGGLIKSFGCSASEGLGSLSHDPLTEHRELLGVLRQHLELLAGIRSPQP